MAKTSKRIEKRNKDIKRLKALREEFETLYWNILEVDGMPTIKDYQVIIILQNDEILRLLRAKQDITKEFTIEEFVKHD